MQDNYCFLSRQTDCDKKKMALSLLPVLAMLCKLMTRKQKGKRPYSEAFAFKDRIEEIKRGMAMLEAFAMTDDDGIVDSRLLAAIGETCQEAMAEVRMASLRRDFVWIGESIENALCCLQGTEED